MAKIIAVACLALAAASEPKYVHVVCEDPDVPRACNLADVQSWPGELCQDAEAPMQGSGRCWQSTLAKAEAICNRQSECTGVTRDNGGYEPRGGLPSANANAHEMWHKGPVPPPSPAPTPSGECKTYFENPTCDIDLSQDWPCDRGCKECADSTGSRCAVCCSPCANDPYDRGCYDPTDPTDNEEEQSV